MQFFSLPISFVALASLLKSLSGRDPGLVWSPQRYRVKTTLLARVRLMLKSYEHLVSLICFLLLIVLFSEVLASSSMKVRGRRNLYSDTGQKFARDATPDSIAYA